ncbi:MAG: aminotransferase [Rhodospirillales bacterium]
MALQPNSAAARDVAYHLHPYTNARKHEAAGPMVISRGEGVRVWDDDGKEYIEGLAGLWSTALGWGNERLAKAAYDQMRKLSYYHSFAHKVPDLVVDLAEMLIGKAPGKAEKVIFSNSGSEANDTAVKIIQYFNNARGQTERKKIISRVNGYHGVTLACAGLTGMEYTQHGFDAPLPFIRHTGCPHHYRFAEANETETQFSARLAAELRQMIEDEGPETIAAFIAEPLQGAGGVIVPPEGYFEAVIPVLKEYDILFWADEVINGFGRLGTYWGSEYFGLQPDIVTCAKALSSSYIPISATMVSDEIYQVLADESDRYGLFGHGYTYSAHPVAAAVALETLKIYEEIDIAGMAAARAPTLQNGLRGLSGKPYVGEVRGAGLIAGVELVADPETGRPFSPLGKVGAYCAAKAQEHGLIIRPLKDTIAFCPPIVISDGDIGLMVERITAALDDTAKWIESEGLAAA